MTTYYHSDTTAAVEAILRDGVFRNQIKCETTGVTGVYLVDRPVPAGRHHPDVHYPDILEVTLPAEVDLCEFEVFYDEGCHWRARWRAWVVPAELLNKSATLRSVPEAEKLSKWREWDDEACNGFRRKLAFVYRFAPDNIPSEIRPRLKQFRPNSDTWEWDKSWNLSLFDTLCDVDCPFLRVIPVDDNGRFLQKPILRADCWIIEFFIDKEFVTVISGTLAQAKHYLDSLLGLDTPEFPPEPQ